MRAGLAIAGVCFMLSGGALADICKGQGPVVFPMQNVLMSDGMALKSDLFETFPMDPRPPSPDRVYDRLLWQALNGLPDRHFDVVVLSLLDTALRYPISVQSAPHAWGDVPFDTALDILSRYGLDVQVAALNRLRTDFPDWDSGAAARKAQVDQAHAAGGAVQAEMDALLQTAAKAFSDAAPSVMDVVQNIVASDPELSAFYETRRQTVSNFERYWHLNLLVMECFETSSEAGHIDYDATAPKIADLAVLFQLAALDYSVAPETAAQMIVYFPGENPNRMATALQAAGLPEQAAAIRRGIARIPGPIPQSMSERDALLQALDDETIQQIAQDFAHLNPGAIRGWIADTAQGMGIWPQ